jgi:hypothetical protein
MCTLDVLQSTSCCLRSCRTSQGLARLEAAIDCPYVSSKSLQALNQAYVQLHASTRHGVPYMQVSYSSTLGIVPLLQVPPSSHSDVVKHKQGEQCRQQDWARILAKVNRTAEACELYEQLADIGMREHQQHGSGAALAVQAAQLCLVAIKQQQGAKLQPAPNAAVHNPQCLHDAKSAGPPSIHAHASACCCTRVRCALTGRRHSRCWAAVSG